MKKILSFLVVAASLISFQVAQAATFTLALGATTGTNTVFTNANAKISSIVITSGDAAAGTFRFIDTPDATQTFVRGAFTGVTSYSTNMVTTFTNFLGVVETQTNAAIFTTTLSVGAATNARNTILNVTIPAGSTYTYAPTSGEWVGMGLMFTNTLITNSSITIKYLPQ